jgi:hypothetical protein
MGRVDLASGVVDCKRGDRRHWSHFEGPPYWLLVYGKEWVACTAVVTVYLWGVLCVLPQVPKAPGLVLEERVDDGVIFRLVLLMIQEGKWRFFFQIFGKWRF